MKKILIFMIMMSILCISIVGADTLIAGVVRENSTSDLIQGANVTVNCNGFIKSILSIEDGSYAFTYLAEECSSGGDLLLYAEKKDLNGSATGVIEPEVFPGWDLAIVDLFLSPAPDNSPPIVSIYSPLEQVYSNNESLMLNYTVVDYGVGVDSCWYEILNSTSGVEKENTTLVGCENSTFNISKIGVYTVVIYSNDTSGNEGQESVSFEYSTAPSVILEYPINGIYLNNNNIYLNFTSISLVENLSVCSLYSDFTGDWVINETFNNPLNNTQVSTSKILPDGEYNWNVICNNTAGEESFAFLNSTFTIDTILPVTTFGNINTYEGSQTLIFNYTSFDTNLQSCKYSIYNNGTIDGLNNNVSFSCNVPKYATATSYGLFTLRVYSIDLAGNENYTENNFTLSPSSIVIIGGGGGSGTIINYEASKNFSIYSENFGDLLDVSMAEDSIRERTVYIYLQNRGLQPIDLDLQCTTEGANESSQEINICDYVTFPNETISVDPNSLNPERVSVKILTPSNSTIGDTYYFNILAVEKSGANYEFSKLSVSAGVTFLGQIRKWSPIGEVLDDGTQRAYPVFWVALAISLLLFTSITIFFSKKKKAFTGFFLSVLISVASFFIFISWL